MLICPQCGWPRDERDILADTAVSCEYCKWTGVSTALLRAEGDAAHDAEVIEKLQYLIDFIAREPAAKIGVELVSIGLVPRTFDAANVARLARITRAVSRAAFRAVVMEIFEVSDAEPTTR